MSRIHRGLLTRGEVDQSTRDTKWYSEELGVDAFPSQSAKKLYTSFSLELLVTLKFCGIHTSIRHLKCSIGKHTAPKAQHKHHPPTRNNLKLVWCHGATDAVGPAAHFDASVGRMNGGDASRNGRRSYSPYETDNRCEPCPRAPGCCTEPHPGACRPSLKVL